MYRITQRPDNRNLNAISSADHLLFLKNNIHPFMKQLADPSLN